MHFEKTSTISATSRELFDWHARPGAFERLAPPWERIRLLRHDGIQDGDIAEIEMKLGPLRKLWVAEHRNYRDGESFQDVQTAGPFAEWEHTHRISHQKECNASITDSVNYRLPFGVFGRALGSAFATRILERMFSYRHQRTRDDLAFHQKYKESQRMNVLITGGTGLIGRELRSLLTTGGHKAKVLTRRQPKSDEMVQWDPQATEFDPAWFDGFDAIIHLAGENIADKRWSDSFKQRLRASRIDVTNKLVAALGKLDTKPKTLVSASAIGWYGDRGNEELSEDAPVGTGFLPELCQQWEESSHPACDMGIRVVNPRIGVVLSPQGGALRKMLLPFKFGLGGKLGGGQQYMSWIGIDDVAAAIAHCVFNESVSGPVNCVAPHPVTNAEFTKSLGRVLSRPTIFPVPAFGARLAFGEMADALLLASTRLKPQALLDSGYDFRFPTLEECLRHVLGR